MRPDFYLKSAKQMDKKILNQFKLAKLAFSYTSIEFFNKIRMKRSLKNLKSKAQISILKW